MTKRKYLPNPETETIERLINKRDKLQAESDSRLEVLKIINEDEFIKACPRCKIIWVDKRIPRQHRDDCELAKELGGKHGDG